ncbi:VOC family protein [Frankia sp. CiP3]|uniref:VOC family protein n=1 Tax=Frankia sp. CiP3 TaxID=2880971 RepID=UPI0035B0FBD3
MDAAHARLLAAGCTHHRGPLTVTEGRRICQVTDPFGNGRRHRRPLSLRPVAPSRLSWWQPRWWCAGSCTPSRG